MTLLSAIPDVNNVTRGCVNLLSRGKLLAHTEYNLWSENVQMHDVAFLL